MLNPQVLQGLKKSYHFLNNLSESEIDVLKEFSITKKLQQGEMIFLEGDTCGFFAFINRGTVRVYKRSETGREITLYRFNMGESCILTASCILSSRTFPAAACAEDEVEAVLIPAKLLKEFVKEYDEWRKYFFNVLAERLSEVMEIVEEVAFRKMDKRIAELLLQISVNAIASVTHKQIASELGTSREVVSRILKDFEKCRYITTSRGEVTITDIPKLKMLLL